MHLIDRNVGFAGSTAIVANSIPVGVGIALAKKLKKKRFSNNLFRRWSNRGGSFL